MKLCYPVTRLLGGILLSVCTYAVPVTPDSYTFTPATTTGTYPYPDETGSQLTDGQFGPSRITSSADATPYVGWLSPLVKITFDFGDLTTFDSVNVSALQAGLRNIVLPDVYLFSSIDGITWEPVANRITPESTVNNFKKTDILLSDLNVTAEYLQLQLRRNDQGPWIFVDEVSFFAADSSLSAAFVQVETVPEVGSTFAIFAMGLAGLGFLRLRR